MSRGETPPTAGRFLVQVWPEGCVVFDRHFGNTHAMDEFTGTVFRCLLEHPGQGIEALRQHLGQSRAPSDQDLPASLEQALQHLSTHGLMPAADTASAR